MRREKKSRPIVDSFDKLVAAIDGFDYGIDRDDFVIYEAGRLLEEDRASFDDAEFRSLIDEGIAGHVEENPAVRAAMAGLLRSSLGDMEAETRQLGVRVIAALEDIEFDLSKVGVVVRSYTGYLLRQLENFDDAAAAGGQHARNQVDLWKSGALDREQLMSELLTMGRPAVAPLADLLFDEPENRPAVELALGALEAIPCPTSARVLAHAVSEPILEEDLEEKAARALRALWPLPRRYMLYRLRDHTHEDLPFRWFQLFITANETSATDRAIEELIAHGDKNIYQEDLAALLGVLLQSQDPSIEEKILQTLNEPKLPKASAAMLEIFLREYRAPAPLSPDLDPWARQRSLLETNRRYRAAASLVDMGNSAGGLAALDEILDREPGYPFAVMLKKRL